MNIEVQHIVDILKTQRNQYADEAANLAAAYKTALDRIAALEKQVNDLTPNLASGQMSTQAQIEGQQ